MFTGIVQITGEIAGTSPAPGGRTIRIVLPGEWPQIWNTRPSKGESVCVDGVCLTVERFDQDTLVFFASQETLEKTTLGHHRSGDEVNLERAATLQSFLGGHLVSGHVDGTGRLDSIRAEGDCRVLTISLHENLGRYLVEKGSICVDGISLTAVNVQAARFDVWIIQHTWTATAIHRKRPGDAVNLECDMIAKMVEKQLRPWLTQNSSRPDLLMLMKVAGFDR